MAKWPREGPTLRLLATILALAWALALLGWRGSSLALHSAVVVCMATATIPPFTLAQTLGPADASLGVKVTDAGSGLKRFEYTLLNHPTSPNTVETFGLLLAAKPDSVQDPPHWDSGYGWEADPQMLAWYVSDADTTWHDSTYTFTNIDRSPFDLQPGDSVTFMIYSRSAVGQVRFYVQGWDSLHSDEEVADSTWFLEGSPARGEIPGPVPGREGKR